MGFKATQNIPGRVFVPDENPDAQKKHACPDCFQCQRCSEDRCLVCRAAGARKIEKQGAAGICGGGKISRMRDRDRRGR